MKTRLAVVLAMLVLALPVSGEDLTGWGKIKFGMPLRDVQSVYPGCYLFQDKYGAIADFQNPESGVQCCSFLFGSEGRCCGVKLFLESKDIAEVLTGLKAQYPPLGSESPPSDSSDGGRSFGWFCSPGPAFIVVWKEVDASGRHSGRVVVSLLRPDFMAEEQKKLFGLESSVPAAEPPQVKTTPAPAPAQASEREITPPLPPALAQPVVLGRGDLLVVVGLIVGLVALGGIVVAIPELLVFRRRRLRERQERKGAEAEAGLKEWDERQKAEANAKQTDGGIMGTIKFPCACGKTVEVDSSWAGKAGRCQACGRLHQVPVPANVVQKAPHPAVEAPSSPAGPKPPQGDHGLDVVRDSMVAAVNKMGDLEGKGQGAAAGIRFCPMCGAKVSLPSGSRFCPMCGASVASVGVESPVNPLPVAPDENPIAAVPQPAATQVPRAPNFAARLIKGLLGGAFLGAALCYSLMMAGACETAGGTGLNLGDMLLFAVIGGIIGAVHAAWSAATDTKSAAKKQKGLKCLPSGSAGQQGENRREAREKRTIGFCSFVGAAIVYSVSRAAGFRPAGAIGGAIAGAITGLIGGFLGAAVGLFITSLRRK